MTRSSYILVAAVVLSLLGSASFQSCFAPSCRCGAGPGCHCGGPLEGGCGGCGGCHCGGERKSGRDQGCTCMGCGVERKHYGCTGWGMPIYGPTCGGCGGCDCQEAAERAEAHPTPAQLDPLIRSYLATHGPLASTMCGVQATGLAVTKIRPSRTGPGLFGMGKLHVTGRPIPAPGAAAPQKLECRAKLAYQVALVGSAAAGATATWRLKNVELSSVSTPGVDWTPPSSHHDWD